VPQTQKLSIYTVAHRSTWRHIILTCLYLTRTIRLVKWQESSRHHPTFGGGQVRDAVQMPWHLLTFGSASLKTKIQCMGDKSGCGLGHKSAISKFNQFLNISVAKTVHLKAGWHTDQYSTTLLGLMAIGLERGCLCQVTDILHYTSWISMTVWGAMLQANFKLLPKLKMITKLTDMLPLKCVGRLTAGLINMTFSKWVSANTQVNNGHSEHSTWH